MANNPLYPGYSPGKPDQDSINPIYPGYYAGQPIQRRPAQKNFIKPIEYNVDAYMEEVDNAARKVLLSPLAGPRWMLDRIVNDWKDQLKVSIKPAELSVTELDDYSSEEYPGAVISLSLNPKDWTKDPKKQLAKTAKDWVKQSTGLNIGDIIAGNDFSDIENKTNRELWQQAMGYGRKQKFNPATRKMEDEIRLAPESIATRTAPQLGGSVGGKADPLNLKNIAVWGQNANGEKIVYKDIYRDTASSVADFVEQWDSPKDREKLRNKYVQESAKGIFTELSTKATDAKYKPFFAKHEDAIKLLGVQVGVLDDVKNLSKGIFGKNSVSEALEKISWNLKGDGDKKVAMDKAMKKLDGVINNAKNNLAAEKQILDILIKNNSSEAKKFKDALKPFEDKISILEDTRQRIASKSPSAALDILRIESRNLVNGSTFDTSIQGKIAGFAGANFTAGEIAKVISEAKDQGIDLHAAKASSIVSRLERERVRFATREVLNQWDQEKMLETYVWNKMKKRLPSIVGGSFIGKGLEKRNYFGLKITEAGTPIDPRRLAKFEKRFGYKTKMKLDSSFSGYGGIGKLTITGGDQFKLLRKDGLFKKFNFSNPNDEILLKGILSGKTNREALAKKLFGCSFKDVLGDNKKKEEYTKFLGEMDAYRHWIMAQKPVFGNQVMHQVFAYKMIKDLTAFNEEQLPGYDLTRKYIGRLEKVHKTSLRVKQWWEGTKVGRAIKFGQEWRTIVSEKFAKWVSNAIAKLLGIAAGATGPLGMVLAALQSVIAFAVEKGLAYATAVLKGIFKGDFEDFIKILGKDFNKVLKSCLVCSTIIAVVVSLPVLLIVTIIGASVSPVDRTVGTTLNRQYIAPNRNENDIMIIEKDVLVTLLGSGGRTIENPTDPIENFELRDGIRVDYTITITPKENVTTASISVEDKGVARPDPPNPKVVFLSDSRIVTPFTKGVEKTYLLSETLRGEDTYKNSRIINTAIAAIPKIAGLTDSESMVGVTRSFSIGYPQYEEVEDCINMLPGDLPPINPNAGPIASMAYQIASNLERGFWCSFNRSPDYPDLWNREAFDSIYPDVAEARTEGRNALFWCTWLIIKSYQSVDPQFPERTLVTNMQDYFTAGTTTDKYKYNFTSRDDATIDQIKPGDVIFYSTYDPLSNPPDGHHVGIVYSKTGDSITTVQSNSDILKLTVNKEGGSDKIIEKIEGKGGKTLTVLGFGSATPK